MAPRPSHASHWQLQLKIEITTTKLKHLEFKSLQESGPNILIINWLKKILKLKNLKIEPKVQSEWPMKTMKLIEFKFKFDLKEKEKKKK